MFNLVAVAMLTIEAQKVVGLRLAKLAWGGHEATYEAHQMVSEKLIASLEAADTLMTGGSFETVIARYREIVAANSERLTAA